MATGHQSATTSSVATTQLYGHPPLPHTIQHGGTLIPDRFHHGARTFIYADAQFVSSYAHGTVHGSQPPAGPFAPRPVVRLHTTASSGGSDAHPAATAAYYTGEFEPASASGGPAPGATPRNIKNGSEAFDGGIAGLPEAHAAGSGDLGAVAAGTAARGASATGAAAAGYGEAGQPGAVKQHSSSQRDTRVDPVAALEPSPTYSEQTTSEGASGFQTAAASRGQAALPAASGMPPVPPHPVHPTGAGFSTHLLASTAMPPPPARANHPPGAGFSTYLGAAPPPSAQQQHSGYNGYYQPQLLPTQLAPAHGFGYASLYTHAMGSHASYQSPQYAYPFSYAYQHSLPQPQFGYAHPATAPQLHGTSSVPAPSAAKPVPWHVKVEARLPPGLAPISHPVEAAGTSTNNLPAAGAHPQGHDESAAGAAGGAGAVPYVTKPMRSRRIKGGAPQQRHEAAASTSVPATAGAAPYYGKPMRARLIKAKESAAHVTGGGSPHSAPMPSLLAAAAAAALERVTAADAFTADSDEPVRTRRANSAPGDHAATSRGAVEELDSAGDGTADGRQDWMSGASHAPSSAAFGARPFPSRSSSSRAQSASTRFVFQTDGAAPHDPMPLSAPRAARLHTASPTDAQRRDDGASRSVASGRAALFLCARCGHKCATKESLRLHRGKCVQRPRAAHSGDSSRADGGAYLAAEGGVAGTRNVAAAGAARRVYPCRHSGCAKHYNHPADLYDHMAAAHEGSKRHKCPMCGNAFYSLGNLTKHIKRLHGMTRSQAIDFMAASGGDGYAGAVDGASDASSVACDADAYSDCGLDAGELPVSGAGAVAE